MKFMRFTMQDSNYSYDGKEHKWNLPLLLDHRKVGLSSMALKLADENLPREYTYLAITSNLIDRNIMNLTGCLALIPFDTNYHLTYSYNSHVIGKF